MVDWDGIRTTYRTLAATRSSFSSVERRCGRNSLTHWLTGRGCMHGLLLGDTFSNDSHIAKLAALSLTRGLTHSFTVWKRCAEIVTMWSVCGGQCHDELNKFSKYQYEIDAPHTGTAQSKCQINPPTLDKTLNLDTEPAFALSSTPSSFCDPRISITDRQAAPTEPNERIETHDAYDPYALCVAMQQSTTMQSVPGAVAQEQRIVVWALAKIAG